MHTVKQVSMFRREKPEKMKEKYYIFMENLSPKVSKKARNIQSSNSEFILVHWRRNEMITYYALDVWHLSKNRS